MINLHYKRREIIFGLCVGIVLGVLSYLLIDSLPTLGRNIPTSDVASDYMRGFAVAVFLTLGVALLPSAESERVPLLLLWAVRSGVTLIGMLFYEYVYGLDAYSYFEEAVSQYTIANQNFDFLDGTNSMFFLTKFAVGYVPFLGSYHALKVLWSFFGFLGTYVFYRAYVNYTGKADIRLLWILGLFPSLVFWSSILGKDPITYLGIALFFYGALPLFQKLEIKNLIFVAVGLSIAGYIRLWLILIFLLPLLILYLFRSRSKFATKAIILAAGIFIFNHFSSGLMGYLNSQSQDGVLDTVSSVASSWSYGGSGQKVAAFNSNLDLIKFLPKGMFAALFRPLPGEIFNAFGLLSSLENMLLLLAVIFTFKQMIQKVKSDLFVQYALLTILIWSSFYSVISYQNLGTAVRFKLQVLPLLLLIPYHIWTQSRAAKNTGAMAMNRHGAKENHTSAPLQDSLL